VSREVAVRRADPRDPADIAHLVRLRWLQSEGQTDDVDVAFRDRLACWLDAETPRRAWWLAERGGDPAGFVGALRYMRMPKPQDEATGWAYLGSLYVLPQHRGHGLGGALVDTVVQWARAEGLVRVVLSPSEMSVPLYRRAGFRDAEELLVLPLV